MKTQSNAKMNMNQQSNLKSRWSFVVSSLWWRKATLRVAQSWNAANSSWRWDRTWDWGTNWKRTWAQAWKR